jgi:hypothetical protein
MEENKNDEKFQRVAQIIGFGVDPCLGGLYNDRLFRRATADR